MSKAIFSLTRKDHGCQFAESVGGAYFARWPSQTVRHGYVHFGYGRWKPTDPVTVEGLFAKMTGAEGFKDGVEGDGWIVDMSNLHMRLLDTIDEIAAKVAAEERKALRAALAVRKTAARTRGSAARL